MRRFEIKPLRNEDRKDKLFHCFYFIKLLIVITPYRSHYSVPDQKIQTIVAFVKLVMLVMVHRSIYPFTKPVPAESFRIKFPAQVTIYIIDNR